MGNSCKHQTVLLSRLTIAIADRGTPIAGSTPDARVPVDQVTWTSYRDPITDSDPVRTTTPSKSMRMGSGAPQRDSIVTQYLTRFAGVR